MTRAIYSMENKDSSPARNKPAAPIPPPASAAPAPRRAPAPEAPDGLAKAKAAYDQLFPVGSPQRRFGPLIAVGAILIVMLLAKCAVTAVGGKISAASQARAEEKRVRTTGVLLVKSNRSEAAIEAILVAAAGEPATETAKGTLGQTLPNLAPGKYTVTLRAAGWPDARGEVEVPAGQQTEVTVNFKGGSLRLESDPAGAAVKVAGAVLGKTPLVIPLLPPGEAQVTLEYPGWPAMTVKTTITENAEAAESVRLPHGRLIVESVPSGATVLLGRRATGQTPLLFERLPVGVTKLTLQAKDFPPLEISATIVDRGEVKVRHALGAGFPVLDPAELLRAVWVPDDRSKVTTGFNATTGIYKPRNDVVKNIHRETLYNRWQHKVYRLAGPVKSYDPATGRLEFAEQKSELARYRVLAQLKPGPAPGGPLTKDATLAVYGRLTAVEEPTWPGRVITLELSDADFLPESTP